MYVTHEKFSDCKPGLPAHLTLSYDSFTDKPANRGTVYVGEILNTNTIEEFKAKDFSGILKSAGEKVMFLAQMLSEMFHFLLAICDVFSMI